MSANNANATGETSGDASDEFRVAVFGVPDDLEGLAKALMALPDMDWPTARLQTHLLPGIIPHSHNQNVAVGVAQEIESLGGKATAVPACEVPDLLHAHPTHHVRLTEHLLEAMDTNDKLQLCDWSAISVISVGVTPSSAPSRFRGASALASGSSHRSWNEGVKISAKRRPEAFIVLSDGQPCLTLASDEMNYEYLEDRLGTSSSANFKLLLSDLVSHAAEAWITPSAIAFLEHTPLPRSEFRSHEEFRRYTEFQTLLSRRHMPPGFNGVD